MTDPLAESVTQHLQRIMAMRGTHDTLSHELLSLAAHYRLEVLRPRLQAALGDVVAGGLFAGMRLQGRASEGCLLPKHLGCYEAVLQPHLRDLVQTEPDVVLNIGCAEGWYAVGMARLLPNAEILAFDTDPSARRLCADMAELNGLARRVRIGEHFEQADFATYAGRRVLVLCDIEGAEHTLLDPVAAPALCGFDLVVEAHDGAVPVSAVLRERFAATHDVTRLDGLEQALPLPACLAPMAEMDRLLAMWEMRRVPTPWLVMRVRR